MASRRTPPGMRSPTATTPPVSIAHGATARSALSPRSSMKATPRGVQRGPSPNGELTVESLMEQLRRETDQREQLLVQLQNKEQTISDMAAESDQLASALNAAESRLAELYTDQTRAEEDMATRMEVTEKLRSQMREAEKERRELQRRYNEQTSAFEAERQAFYDNEQHLKSRIQTLSQSLNQIRRQPSTLHISPSLESESETEVEEEPSPTTTSKTGQDLTDPEQEPAEVTALKLELSTLSTSYASLQTTISLFQSQLVDLKRVNRELQEENESYMILLREKTLSGQYNVSRHIGGDGSSASDEDDGDEEIFDAQSIDSSRSGLDTVNEVEEEQLDREEELERSLHADLGSEFDVSDSRRRSHGRKRGSSTSHSPTTQRGESLAGLPLTGPGLDLAAELGRAENKDILDGTSEPSGILDHTSPGKRKRGRKSISSSAGGMMAPGSSLAAEMSASANKSDVEALRNEVKSLKDANKALSLYASKIIDRIIAQEGFEHVLSVDYNERSPTTPSAPQAPLPEPEKTSKKPRPQSAFFAFSSTTTPASQPPNTAGPALTTFDSLPPSAPPPIGLPPTRSTATIAAAAKRDRRSFSLDWSSFSLFSGDKKPAESAEKPNPSLRPLTLKPGATPITSPPLATARKLETVEDEEDRKERERLAATMKLMGIEKPQQDVMPPPLTKSYSTPTGPSQPSPPAPEVRPPLVSNNSTGSAPSRWSFFRSRSATTTSAPVSGTSSPNPNTPNLTQEALQQVEAEQKLAALDAHEKSLSEQLAKGGSSGFTEPMHRAGSRRGRLSGHGSGSTVWSAGMSKGSDD